MTPEELQEIEARWNNGIEVGDDGNTCILDQRIKNLALENFSSLLACVRERNSRIKEIQKLVDAQANDEGLWFYAESPSEAYLQKALRDLHTAIETKTRINSAQHKEIGRLKDLIKDVESDLKIVSDLPTTSGAMYNAQQFVNSMLKKIRALGGSEP